MLNSFDPELQLKDVESAIRNILIDLLSELRGFKFMTTLALEFETIENDDKTIYNACYSNSKAETIINESDINDLFEPIYSTIISNMQNSLGKGSGWIIDLIINHDINISKYSLLAVCSYIKLPKEFNHPRKGLIMNALNGV